MKKLSVEAYLAQRGINVNPFREIEIDHNTIANIDYTRLRILLPGAAKVVDTIVSFAGDVEAQCDLVEMLLSTDGLNDCYFVEPGQEEYFEAAKVSLGGESWGLNTTIINHTSEPSRGNVLTSIGSTCKGCSEVKTCIYAWDPYNTDGDCLASK